MSGPPYPHPNPAPGSNAIGSFQIGVSPIGTIQAFDTWATIISQYANSPTMCALLTSLNAAIDQTENIDEFYDTVWNVLTAGDYGLNIWGRIVGVARTLQLPNENEFLGFQEAGSWTGFNQGTFFSGNFSGSSYTLSTEAYRLLILAKAAANIWDGSIPKLNQILLSLFPNQGNCYVIDNLNLSMVYRFDFLLSEVSLAIVSSGVLPKPSGVSVSIVQGPEV